MVLSELPVGNVASAPWGLILNLGVWRRSAEAPQGVGAAVKLPHRPGRPSRPHSRCLVGQSGGKQAAALTWWRENVRRLRVARWRIRSSAQSPGRERLTPSVAEPEHFTGVARIRPLLTQGWPTFRSLGFKLLWIYLCFLAINVFIYIVTQVQPCHTIKFGYVNLLFMNEMLNDWMMSFWQWHLIEMIFILQTELFYKYLLPGPIPY